ncbi:MAG: chitobiase/beta-hexosaminidase C-terminal domain-containing protein [Hyphomonadaceae bacterium]|nr:chitobiase/beta-hexosaminidase C-terminal domain-containing protein [Clostridia bacterium]
MKGMDISMSQIIKNSSFKFLMVGVVVIVCLLNAHCKSYAVNVYEEWDQATFDQKLSDPSGSLTLTQDVRVVGTVVLNCESAFTINAGNHIIMAYGASGDLTINNNLNINGDGRVWDESLFRYLYGAVTTENGGSVHINGSNITSTAIYGVAVSSYNGNMQISNGTITANNDSGFAVYADGGTVNVSGGTISASQADGVAACAQYGGKLNITGGVIQGYSAGVSARGYSYVNISGGQITGSSYYGAGVYSYGNSNGMSVINITGGSITSTGKYATAVWANSDVDHSSTGSAIVLSGDVQVNVGAFASQKTATGNGKIYDFRGITVIPSISSGSTTTATSTIAFTKTEIQNNSNNPLCPLSASGAVIRYTTDGTTPTAYSTIYTVPILATAKLIYILEKDGFVSKPTTLNYLITLSMDLTMDKPSLQMLSSGHIKASTQIANSKGEKSNIKIIVSLYNSSTNTLNEIYVLNKTFEVNESLLLTHEFMNKDSLSKCKVKVCILDGFDTLKPIAVSQWNSI